MAASNATDDINLQNLKIEESTTTESKATAGPTKEKTVKPKEKKPKQEKPQAAVAEAPAEELDFNRTPEEVLKALEQWLTKPSTLNQLKPDEKM
jgi:hypothetical protein